VALSPAQLHPPSPLFLGPITTVDVFLPRVARRARVEIRIDAYHTAFLTRPKPQQAFDGYILAYSARRRASLAHLKALAQSAVPPAKRGAALLLVAVGEVTDFFNDHETNALLTEGNELADQLRARFITVSPNADQQGRWLSLVQFVEDELFRWHVQRIFRRALRHEIANAGATFGGRKV
jgi:hypothetical protein